MPHDAATLLEDVRHAAMGISVASTSRDSDRYTLSITCRTCQVDRFYRRTGCGELSASPLVPPPRPLYPYGQRRILLLASAISSFVSSGGRVGDGDGLPACSVIFLTRSGSSPDSPA